MKFVYLLLIAMLLYIWFIAIYRISSTRKLSGSMRLLALITVLFLPVIGIPWALVSIERKKPNRHFSFFQR
jgi:hypothetical protein